MNTTLKCYRTRSFQPPLKLGMTWTDNSIHNSLTTHSWWTPHVQHTLNFLNKPAWMPSLHMLKNLNKTNGHSSMVANRIVVILLVVLHIIAHTKRSLVTQWQSIPFGKTTAANPHFVCGVVPSDTEQVVVTPQSQVEPSTPSIVNGKRINSYQNPTKPSVLASMSMHLVPNTHQLLMAPTLVPYAMTATIPHAVAWGIDLSSILYKVIIPYKPDGWRLALASAGLTDTFPNLVHNITYGTPIGNPPLLTHMFIPNNLSSADIDPAYMDSFIQEELDVGHFDCPFTIQQAHIIFNGHFHTCTSWVHWKARLYGSQAYPPSLQGRCIWSVHEQLAGPVHGCHNVLHSSWCHQFCEFDFSLLFPTPRTTLSKFAHSLSQRYSPLPYYIYIASQYAVEAWGIFFLRVSILVLGISLDHGRRSGTATV